MIPDRTYYLAGAPVVSQRGLDVIDKFRGTVCARVGLADAAAVQEAFTHAHGARAQCASMPAFERANVLRAIAKGLEDRRAEFAKALVAEVGKPIRDARTEIERAIGTFSVGAEEATRITGAYLPLDNSPRASGVEAITARFPAGVASLITPFNFPINLAAHKLAPAIAAGCPWVLKPSEKTPATSIMLGEIIAGTTWPKNAWSILPTTVEDAGAFVTDDRAAILSFTGSSAVGWSLRAKAGKKKVLLELGGDAACIVDEGADLKRAIARLMVGIYSTSGQSCISVQRVLVHHSIMAQVRSALVDASAGLKFGDPSDEATTVGPLISERDAERLEKWIAEAVMGGAMVLTGGARKGSVVEPTLLENVPDFCALGCQEAFGPIAVLESFDRFEDALGRINRSRFGLQTGIFTSSIERAMLAFRTLEVGGVIINDVPTFRTDAMPYGGVKDSGVGREGVRWAIEEFTEPRLLVFSNIGHGAPS